MADIKTPLVEKIDADLPDQQVGGITPEIQRGVLTAVVDVVQGVEDGVVDVAAKTSTLKDRVDELAGRPVFTEAQRAGLAYIVEQSGGAEGLVLAVAANTDKVSFDPESRATLTRLAGETERSEEDVLALIQSAPIPTAVAAEFLSVHGNIDDINGRIDNLPASETIPQSVLDDIQALKDRLEFTPAEQMTIMANADGIATNAQSVLDLIQSVADANARIDGNRDARRITPQEIQDIVDLKAQIADLEDNLELTPEQAQKINDSDAIHAGFADRIHALELSSADGIGIVPTWPTDSWFDPNNGDAPLNLGDLIVYDGELYQANKMIDNTSFAASPVQSPADYNKLADSGLALADFQGMGDGVGAVEDIIDKQLTFDIFESVIGSTAEIRPGTTYTGNRGYQNDNGDDIPQTPPTTATFTIPTSGDSVSAEINALNDGDLIRLVGNFNPNQRYVSGSQTSTRLVVKQGDKTIKIIDNQPPNGGVVILDGVKKGPDLTAEMTFGWNGITATMEPEIGGLDVSFTGRMYHPLNDFVNTRVAESVDPLKGIVGELGTGLRSVQETAQSNAQGLTAVKKTLGVLGAKHTPALDALSGATLSQVDNQVLTETTTAYNKVLHENPTQFNEGLVNLTAGQLTIGDVVLAEVKNGGLFFNLHDAGTPASSNIEPRYIGRANGESNPVEVHLDSEITTTLTNNLPPAGSPVRIFVEADVNGLDVEDEQLDLVATIGESVSHEVVHLGAVVSLTATWQANGLLIQTRKSGTPNQAVDAGRLLVNPVWQETITTDKVDASDTLTRISDHHGNAALFIHSVGGIYHIDYSGGAFDTNTAHTAQTQINTDLDWVITLDSNFPANMHDLQAQADANNEFLGLWYYVNHPSQVLTLPFGVETTNPDGSVSPVGGGGESSVKVARFVLTGDGNAPAVLPEGAVFAGQIRTSNIQIPDLTLGEGEVRRIIGYGARVIVKSSIANTTLSIGLVGSSGAIDLLDAELALNLMDTDVATRLSLGKDDGSDLYFEVVAGFAPSADCQVEIAIKYIKEQLF